MNTDSLHRGPSSHLNTIDVLVNGQHLTEAVCDGLIVSIPTSSTICWDDATAGGEVYFGKSQHHVMHILTQIEFLVGRPPSPALVTTVKPFRWASVMSENTVLCPPNKCETWRTDTSTMCSVPWIPNPPASVRATYARRAHSQNTDRRFWLPLGRSGVHRQRPFPLT